MGVGFNSQGTNANDNIILGYDTHSNARSWWLSANVFTGNNTTRFFFKNNGEGLYWVTGVMAFTRAYSSTSGVWTWPSVTSVGFVNSGSRNIVITHAGDLSQPKLWIDGVSYTTNTSTTPVGTLTNSTNNLLLGNRVGQAQAFSWICSGMGIWNEQLPDEIARSLSLGYSPLKWRQNLAYFNPFDTIASQSVILGASAPTVSGAQTRANNRISRAA